MKYPHRPSFDEYNLEEECAFCDERAYVRITGVTHAGDSFYYRGEPADDVDLEFFACLFHYHLIRRQVDDQ